MHKYAQTMNNHDGLNVNWSLFSFHVTSVHWSIQRRFQTFPNLLIIKDAPIFSEPSLTESRSSNPENPHDPSSWGFTNLMRFYKVWKYPSIDPKQFHADSFGPMLVKNDFLVRRTFPRTPNCFINDFVGVGIFLVRPHSSLAVEHVH